MLKFVPAFSFFMSGFAACIACNLLFEDWKKAVIAILVSAMMILLAIGPGKKLAEGN